MANTWISRAATGSVTSDKTFTYSIWFKRGASNGSNQYLWIHENASSHTQKIDLHLRNDDLMRMGFWDGSNEYNLDSKMLFKDTNAWYHIVFRFDTTQYTASDRIRWYVNGEQIELTAIGGGSPTPQYPAQNTTMNLGQRALVHGRYQSSNPGSYWTGSMSHIHYCDGQSYAPTEFGETDSTTGEWKIKTSPSVSYGNNGYFILKDGNSVTNQAGNSSGNFSVSGGTLTKTEDNPSNVFCTLNPLSTDSGVTLSSGNTESDYDGSVGNAKGTLGFTSGKFYWEAKIATASSDYPMLGIGSLDEQQMQKPTGGSYPGGFTNSYGTYGNGNVYANGSNTGSQSFTYATNDIIGIAVDLDSGTKTIKWYKNGSQIATYNITTVAPFTSMDYNGGESAVNVQYNFGNGYFGTTAVSSAGTNASGNGIFEYDVPTGYTALSTKGLNL